ncbi:plastocyanin [Pseudomonas taeanensis MS-3]|uniref:Plastocyanin n=1 Tax=Pseudomonas taeanensis MS-3 TaxID=1395571 RepID=A0A0A1YMV9_9PSED|nr:plastocyanin/azurin family copper-binding protein [Pseudomonas taeanensis]KFX69989.1 plastocyanin [Pseudomonas taeanensis MS-3]
MNARRCSFLLAVFTWSAASAAMAGAGHVQEDIGRPGPVSAADRTIEIRMGDIFFAPTNIAIKPGETVRFVLLNEGSLLHEFNIGTAVAHAAHQKEMMSMFQNGTLSFTGKGSGMGDMSHAMGGMKMVGMEHNDPNSVLIEPGATAELVWTFAKNTRLEFACNVPGHYQSGMVGQIKVK